MKLLFLIAAIYFLLKGRWFWALVCWIHDRVTNHPFRRGGRMTKLEEAAKAYAAARDAVQEVDSELRMLEARTNDTEYKRSELRAAWSLARNSLEQAAYEFGTGEQG